MSVDDQIIKCLGELTVEKAGELTSADRKELKDILGNKAFRRYLAVQLKLSDDISTALLKANLKTDEGVKNAIELQGRANGISDVIESLLEFIFTEEKSNDDSERTE